MEDQKYSCLVCDRYFSTKHHLKKHQLTQHAGHVLLPYRCSRCQVTFKRRSHLRCHLITAHPDDRTSYCLVCDLLLSLRNRLVSETLSKQNRDRPYICPRCGRNWVEVLL